MSASITLAYVELLASMEAEAGKGLTREFLQRAQLRSASLIDIERSIEAQATLESRMKECYYNAQRLALMFPGEVVYWEGFAHSIIPTPHAWCVGNGTIIETTWPVAGEYPPIEYLGVPVPVEYIYSGWATGFAKSLLPEYLLDLSR